MAGLSPPPDPTTSEEQPRQGWTALDWVVTAIFVLVVGTALVMELLQHWGLASKSQEDAAIIWLVAGIGLTAGFVAALQRKRGDLQAAVTGYRIALWCWFFAFVLSGQYLSHKQRDEAFERHLQEQRRMIEQTLKEKQKELQAKPGVGHPG
jgi:hypothetical protein